MKVTRLLFTLFAILSLTACSSEEKDPDVDDTIRIAEILPLKSGTFYFGKVYTQFEDEIEFGERYSNGSFTISADFTTFRTKYPNGDDFNTTSATISGKELMWNSGEWLKGYFAKTTKGEEVFVVLWVATNTAEIHFLK